MRHNPIQFAVVREDPLIEAELVSANGAGRVMLIGSGGCTALTLAALFPQHETTVVDPNPDQLALIRRKMGALREGSMQRKQSFNIGRNDASGLNACGNFESLFRSLRLFLHEFVLSEAAMSGLVCSKDSLQNASKLLFSHKYWPVAFDLHFSDAMLTTMFGAAAVQHAPKASYPRYFQAAFERGLMAQGAEHNYFLHHVFLGCYREDEASLPPYLTRPVPDYKFHFVQATADLVEDLGSFDLISLSNILDWMSEAEIAKLSAVLGRAMKPGATLVFRQLNHLKDFSRYFGGFRFDEGVGHKLLSKDRSLFYSRLNVATKL